MLSFVMFLPPTPIEVADELLLKKVVKAEAPNLILVTIKGKSKPVWLKIPGFTPGAKDTWPYFGPLRYWEALNQDPNLEVRIRVAKVTREVVVGEPYIDGVSCIKFLADRGYAKNSRFKGAEARAKKEGRGLWIRKARLPRIGESFEGQIIEVLSPSKYRVLVAVGNSNYNSAPALRVRLADIEDSRVSTASYRVGHEFATSFRTRLYPNLSEGTFTGDSIYKTTFRVMDLDANGVLACWVTYPFTDRGDMDQVISAETSFQKSMLTMGLAKAISDGLDTGTISQLREWEEFARSGKAKVRKKMDAQG